jgi:hypothetical protein
MKNLLFFLILSLLFTVDSAQAQNEYTVDGTTYQLNIEAEGLLTLLWNVIDNENRYFSKKGDAIVELKNLDVNGTFQEEYKETLKIQTSENQVGIDNIEFTLSSLKYFFDSYNHSTNSTVNNAASIKLNTRLGGFLGVSNNIYVSNPDNTLLTVAGIDFELMESSFPRHALVVRFKQTFEHSDYKFSSSQVSLNYRFKFIKKETFDIFINTKFPVDNDDDTVSIVPDSSGDFQALGNFGIGFDYALGNGYLTFLYNDIIGLGLDNNGEFPLDLTLGYKFNL